MKVFSNKIKNVSLGNFGAKLLAVALVAGALAFVGCKQSAGGGAPDVPSAPTPKQGQPENNTPIGKLSIYRFYTDAGESYRVSLRGTVTFAEICANAGEHFENDCIDGDITGWTINDTTDTAAGTDEFSVNTEFYAVYSSSAGKTVNKYVFKDAEESVGEWKKAGEVTFEEIKRTAIPNFVYESNFLYWKIEGKDVPVIDDNEKFSASTVLLPSIKLHCLIEKKSLRTT